MAGTNAQVRVRACMFLREVNVDDKLYSLDVLGIEDRGETDQLDVLR